ncbi:MAG: peptide chain release factor N(5)-glutamine methyltransferase [Peptostreptococcaceae bacterium]
MKIKDIIMKYENKLKKISDTPRLDIELILQKVLFVDKLYIMLNLEKEITDLELENFIDLINQRLDNRPVAYITEHREFMGLDFFVKEGVLIPRCDTETLVEEIIKIYENNHKKEIKILDIGTGSGAISVSLAKYLKNSKVTSFDIEETPLEVGKLNAKTNNVDVEFLKSDLFEVIKDSGRKFDIIVSNPPYIPYADMDSLHCQVKDYEPHSALFANNNGLFFYEEITKQSGDYLNEGGILAYEVGYNQSECVVSIMEKYNFNKIYKIKDIQGIDRVVIGYKL